MAREARDKDRALAQTSTNNVAVPDPDVFMEDEQLPEEPLTAAGQEALGSKVVVIHPGSQNLRIGLASDALPKTVPMVIARKWAVTESEVDGGEPRPKRLKTGDEIAPEPEKWFGEEVGGASS